MNAKVYSLLLTVCPADLRRDFGAEMTQVFLEDLADHRRRFGFRGAARVWQRSFTDLCGAALQEAIAQRLFAVPLILYGMEILYAGMIFLVHPELFSVQAIVRGFLVSPGLIPPMVAFVAARVTNRSVPVPLSLRR